MRRPDVAVVALIVAAFMLAACSNGPSPGRLTPDEGLKVPPLAGTLPDLAILADQQALKGSSVIRNMQMDLCGHSDNAVVTPASVQLPSEATEASAAWWGITLSYQVQADPDIYLPVPYLAPYEVTVTNDGGGEFWVALPDYKSGYWDIHADTYSGTEVTIPVGLEPNTGNLDGSFWIAIITYGGTEVTVTDIAMDFPEPLNNIMGNPVEFHQFIEGEDGTQLATSVLFPYANPLQPAPPYPVVLFRTPYAKSSIWNTQLSGFSLPMALGGLNVMLIAQYHRGRVNDTGAWPDSGGTETLFREHNGPDYHDAIDTVEWIEDRHFYNGTLVMSGPSALGLCIYQAAPGLTDRLAGIFPQISAGNVANWAALRNGCYKWGNVLAWLDDNQYPPELIEESDANFNNPDYWEALDFDSQASSVDCPGYHETGWWDVDVEATIHSWKQLNTNGAEGAAGNQWLVIGPWSHETLRGSTVGEINFPSSPAEHDATSIPAQWDGYLWALNVLGRNGAFVTPEQNVYVYFMGSSEAMHRTSAPNNHWYALDDWPPAYSEQTFYLQNEAVGLIPTVPVGETSLNWDCDPAWYIDTVGGNNLPSELQSAGPRDQTDAEMHAHSKLLRSDALVTELPMAGPITIKLFVSTTVLSSDIDDTDIMVKLIDEYPDGTNMLVADSAVRLSWYLAQNELGAVVPDTVYEVDLEIGQRAYVFETGHKIGIDLQSTNYPRYDVNPGNGDPFYDGSNGELQNNMLYMGGTNLSALTLPYFDPEA